MDQHGFSVGEVGGWFAGGVAVLVAIGHGVRWILGFRERRSDSLYQKNLKWEERLAEREAAFERDQLAHFTRIETRLTRAELQVEAALGAYHLLAGEMRRKDPENAVLRMAEELLKEAFRLDPVVPADMKKIVDRLN